MRTTHKKNNMRNDRRSSVANGKEEKKKNKKNQNAMKRETEEVVIVSLSSDSEEERNEDEQEEEVDDVEEEEEEAKSSNNSNQNSNLALNKDEEEEEEKEADVEEEEEEENDVNRKKILSNGLAAVSGCFPFQRIKRMIRSEFDIRTNAEAVFLINKATEKFLESLTEDAYACTVQDRKKSIRYNHLSSVVSKRKSYDFLSDFVPQKIRADDALEERRLART